MAHSHADGHAGHPHQHAMNAGRRAIGISLALATGVMALEIGVGVWTNALVLLSDATHMFTDALSLVVAFAAATMRARPRAGRSTFGMRRLPVLGGMFNAVLVLIASAFIVVEAIHRIGAPQHVDGAPVVAVAVVGLCANLFGAFLMARSGDHSVNLRGAMLHMLGDALGSVAALVSGVVLFVGGPPIVDAIASVVVAAIITVGAVRLLLDVGSILLERAPAHVDVDAVEKLARAVPGVDNVVGLHAWELDSGEAVASLVLVTTVHDLVELARAADELREQLMSKFRIAHTTIEWRPTVSPRPCCEPFPAFGHAHEEPDDDRHAHHDHDERHDHDHGHAGHTH